LPKNFVIGGSGSCPTENFGTAGAVPSELSPNKFGTQKIFVINHWLKPNLSANREVGKSADREMEHGTRDMGQETRDKVKWGHGETEKWGKGKGENDV